ncbi:hypothetical protein XH96_01410 [Bradyrhizobium sp. CCBAU 51765]|nr:hypothetical protein XH96_01410 [Bradyrhizobium sp. CCBAU 51765]
MRRSNPASLRGKILDCFAALAMTVWGRTCAPLSIVMPGLDPGIYVFPGGRGWPDEPGHDGE